MKLGRRIFKTIACFFFTFIVFNYDSLGQSYGLAFASHEVYQDKRTGLDLSPGKTLCFNDNFDISFDLSFIVNRKTYFGYIVRIIEDDKRNIDLVYDAQTKFKHFNVIIGERFSKISFDIERDQLFNSWNNIRVKFDFDHDRILFYNGKTMFVESGLHLKKNSCYKILFGTNNYRQFQSTDIPPMKLRNILIKENSKLKYNWPLSEESGLTAHEVVNQNDAAVVNPVWVTAMHRDWQSVQSITVNGVAGIAFDPLQEQLYVIASDSLHNYSFKEALWKNTSYNKLDLNQGNQSIFNPFDHRLYSFFVDQKFATKYNFQTHNWDKKFKVGPITDYWHLNKFFSLVDSSLYFLGGYGHLVYKNKIQRYHLNTATWDTVNVKGDFFMPRYLSALGATSKGDTAYILGGYGNSSGLQILNPQNIYDMMRFTVKDGAFKKLFVLKVKGEDFALANSLVIDDKTKTYYGLIFPQHKYNSTLQLIKGSLTKPSYEMVGSAIPYLFHDTHSFADLYYCPVSKRFIAVTLLRSENNQTKINIYTLLSPPYGGPEIAHEVKNNRAWYLGGAFAAITLLFLFYVSRRKGTSKKSAETNPLQPTNPSNTVTEHVKVVKSEISEFNHANEFKNAILLFGDLQVFDAEGADITKHFTPLIKELFLVILLYTIRWGRGLSSEKLNEILWYDKSVKSARNNRSVNIAKLKALLDKMDHCHLSNDTGYWKFDIDYQHTYVDYHNYLNIINDKKELDIQKIKCLSEITQRGNFLSNIEYEWLDTFKSETSNEIIDTYLHFANSQAPNDFKFLVELSNFIFHFDPVNEEAMVIKCKALSALGKHSLAKNTFESFIKEYRIIYGEEFKKDFHAVLV
ncbi:galactose oxidase [Mucilaginibacter sp.]|jgi:DNA-binding SARP family transcriptional activator|uniref:galactose oxidase n=1 Tax=Mucilaginibacter sp. TaxID=1882438 RepID=UPI0035681ECD